VEADSPQSIMSSLGRIEDDMEKLLPEYAQAAGTVADFEMWHRRTYLMLKAEMKDAGLLEHDSLGVPAGKVTETLIRDTIEHEMHKRFEPAFVSAKQAKHQKAMGDVLFKGLDARRSIGQTLLKPHMANESKFGQGS
jgi:hypothetical protein